MREPRFFDKSAHSLRLRLYDGRVDRSALAVFAQGSAVGNAIQIDAAVIGSSHWMELRAGDLVLTEMLACQPAPAGRPLEVWRPGEAGIDRIVRSAVRYAFDARVLSRADASAELVRLSNGIGGAHARPAEVGLAFEFPAPDGGECGAETLVWAAVTGSGATVRTAHTYPSEGLVVVSRTEMRLALAGRAATGLAELAAV